jgi:hypothetical protein
VGSIARTLTTLSIALCTSALAVYLVMGIVWHRDTYDAKRKGWPRTEQDCTRTGGTWTRGPFGETICQRRSSDAGKRCQSAADCEGACLGERSGDSRTQTGACSADLVIYGCNLEVERTSSSTTCRD